MIDYTYEARNLGINALHRIDYCRKSNLGMCTWPSIDYGYYIQVHDDIVYSEYVNIAHAGCNLSCNFFYLFWLRLLKSIIQKSFVEGALLEPKYQWMGLSHAKRIAKEKCDIALGGDNLVIKWGNGKNNEDTSMWEAQGETLFFIIDQGRRLKIFVFILVYKTSYY